MSGKAEGTTTPRTLDDLATAVDKAALEESGGSGGETYTFEGGPLDGQSLKRSEIAEAADVKDPEATDDKAVPDGNAASTEGDPDQGDLKEEDGEPSKDATEVAADKAASETPSTDPAAAEGETKVEAYQPNHKYKVYDEEKEFPDWAKKVATTKESEENLRTSLQKAEAFDVIKPKHTEVLRERDEARRGLQEDATRVQHLMKTRDTDLGVFFKKMGVSRDAVIRYASDVLKAEEDPALARAIVDREAAVERSLDNEFVTTQQQQQQASTFETQHQTALNQTFALPEVQSFKTRMDQVHGPGSFDAAFRNVGSLAYQRGEGYVPPNVVAQRVMETYGKGLPQSTVPTTPVVSPVAPAAAAPVSAPGTKAASAAAPANGGQAPSRERVKTLPNVGRATSVTPAKRVPMRNLDDVKKRTDAELSEMA